MIMASSESSHSNPVTDISHVLESLGSLIGELDAIEIDKVDELKSCEDSHGTSDLSLKTLLADTDEFDDDDDDDEKQFLIPHQSSPMQKAWVSFDEEFPGYFGHMNSTAQGHEKTTYDPVYDSPAGSKSSHSLQPQNSVPLRTQELDNHYAVPTGTRATGVSTSQFSSLQPQTSVSLRTQEHDNHYSVPPSTQATGINNSQHSSLQSQMTASLRTPTNDNHSVLTGTRARGINTSQSSSLQSHNTGSLKSQAHNSHYSVPPSRGGHKGASKEVALSAEVHGSFKKFDDGFGVASAQKKIDIAASHPKAEPNHYVTPGELGLPRSSQVNEKPNDGGNHNSKQIKQGGHISQDVPVNVFNEEDKPIGLLVSSSMKAREACHKLVLLNKVEDDPQWVLVEYLADLGLERCCEDHENVMAILKTWAPGSNNKLLFRRNYKKYHFFAHTSNYFPPHLLDSENSDKAVTEKAQKAKTILHQKLFSTCTRVPEVEGYLHCKEFGKKSWSKKFIFLRGSGLYSSSKGKSKASTDLECYVQFDGANLYNILNPKKSHKAPTEFCFCIVPFRARELKELKCFCVDDEKTLMSWNMAVRIAKFGPQLRQNYDDMLRKFAKLTKYRDQQNSSSNNNNNSHKNVISERVDGEINSTPMKEGQVAMDFTGETGRVITDSKEIQELANTRPKVKLSRRTSSQHFIPTDTAISGHEFMSESWYHGRITREQSLELLMNAGVQDGLFLVRESSSVAGVFVLTFCMNRRVYHCQLVQDIGEGTQTFFSLGKGPAFKTLQELIHFYQQKPLNGVSLALRIPCPKAGYSGYLES